MSAAHLTLEAETPATEAAPAPVSAVALAYATSGMTPLKMAIAAFESYRAEVEQPLSQALHAAEVAAQQYKGDNDDEVERLNAAIANADAKWQPALTELDRLGQAILEVPVTGPAEAIEKQEAYRRLVLRPMGGHPFVDELEAALAAATRDITGGFGAPTGVADWDAAATLVRETYARSRMAESTDADIDAHLDAIGALERMQPPSIEALVFRLSRSLGVEGDVEPENLFTEEGRATAKINMGHLRDTAVDTFEALLALCPIGDPGPFNLAKSNFLELAAKANAAATEEASAYDAYCAGRPTAPPEAYVYESGKPIRVMRLDEIDKQTKALPPVLAEQIRNAVTEHRAADDLARGEFKVDELEDAASAAFSRKGFARDQLLELPAPDAAAMAFKLCCLADEHLNYDLNNPDDVDELLLDGEPHARTVLTLYRDACRLAGLRDLTSERAPFDPAAWIEGFEAFPGHRMTRHGPSYQCPIAWGPEAPTDDDLTVTDADAIRRYRGYVRSAYTDEQWDALTSEERERLSSIEPIRLGYRGQADAFFPEGGAEHARLTAAWDLRVAINKGERPALGAHLWRDLPSYKRDAVFAYLKANPAPEDIKDPDIWLDAFEEAGGTVSIQHGDLFLGHSFPATSRHERLLAVCVGRLRDEVQREAKERLLPPTALMAAE